MVVSVIADWRLAIGDWRFPIADWRFPIADWRLAIADWKLQIGNRKSEIGNWKSEIGNRKSEIGNIIMDAQELKERTKSFSLRVIKLVGALPNTVIGRAIGNQLVRSGTSVGANYRAACRSRSKAEFIAKMGIVEEEADESAFWMELIMDEGLLKKELVQELHQEATELTAIMAASRISASRNRKLNVGRDKKLANSDFSEISNRQSAIANPKSQISNRK